MIEWLNNDLASHEEKNDYSDNEYDYSDNKCDKSDSEYDERESVW